MAAQLCCLQSAMASDSPLICCLPPSNPVFIKQPHHLSVQQECVHRQGLEENRRCQILPSILEETGGGRGSERLTAGLLWLKPAFTGPCSLLVLSLAASFSFQNLFPPFIPR